MAGPTENYQKLKLRDALSLPCLYLKACTELAFILGFVYSNADKCLKSRLLEDTLLAIHLLPQMQTQTAVTAAKLLIESATSAFPWKKQIIVVFQFMRAKAAHKWLSRVSSSKKKKRLSRTQKDDLDRVELHEDVLVHVFSYLDVQSLASAEKVCRSWRTAANNNWLWKFHYTSHFGDSNNLLKTEWLQSGSPAENGQCASSNGVDTTNAEFDWKYAFKRAYIGFESWKYKLNRGYCCLCDLIVWPNNLKCPNQHSSGQVSGNQRLKPVKPYQIGRYIFDDGPGWLECSLYRGRDSESDDE